VITGLFTVVYAFIPNTRVRLRAALVGGLTAGLLWAVTGRMFTALVLSSAHLTIVYAGFAIFIAALVWTYFGWLILLLGAQLSFYVQNPRYMRAGQVPVRLTSRLRERLALSLMLLIARAFLAGDKPWQLRRLAERLEIAGSALSPVIQSLEQAGLLTMTDREEVLPARDLEAIDIHDILQAVRDERQYETWLLGRAATEPAADALADGVEAAIRERTSGQTLRELAAR
jgi:membrane protein